ncbi:MAG TPA: hypothetical protein PKV66_02565 [Candidatus Pelethenecus sp.]|nr:hypothetical protein [Candidatus Pelethenecus sp.]
MERLQPGSYITFLREIKGKGLSKTTLERKFREMVEKEDYDKRDFDKLINHALKYGSTKPFTK